jgi:VanZ family protein
MRSIKYRRSNPRDGFINFIRNGLTGLGIMVVGLSLTQGLNGIIGILLVMLIISAFYGLATWLGGILKRLFQGRQSVD